MMIDLEYSIFSLAVIVLYIGSFIYFKFKSKKDWRFLLFYTIFYIYLVEVVNLTQFPIYISEQEISLWNRVSFIPFVSLNPAQSFFNIVLTIPFGFGLPFLIRISWKRVIVCSLIFTFCIELTQFIVGVTVGSYRIADIDDIIFNFIGSLLGYLLFLLFKQFCFRIYGQKKEKAPKLFQQIVGKEND